MKPKFVSSRDSNEKCTMHTRSDNVEIMIGKDANKTIQELFYLLLDRYKESLAQSMNSSGFVSDHTDR